MSSVQDVRGPAAIEPLAAEAPAQIVVAPPLPESLAHGRVVIQYDAKNVRIVPVYGPAALAVSPRIGHIHVTVDDAPWRWIDASNEPITINGLPPGAHKVRLQLVNANHQPIDEDTVTFVIPQHGG